MSIRCNDLQDITAVSTLSFWNTISHLIINGVVIIYCITRINEWAWSSVAFTFDIHTFSTVLGIIVFRLKYILRVFNVKHLFFKSVKVTVHVYMGRAFHFSCPYKKFDKHRLAFPVYNYNMLDLTQSSNATRRKNFSWQNFSAEIFSYTDHIFLPTLEGSMYDRSQFKPMMKASHICAAAFKVIKPVILNKLTN